MNEYFNLFNACIESEDYPLAMRIVDDHYRKKFKLYTEMLNIKRMDEHKETLHEGRKNAINSNVIKIRENLNVLFETSALLTELRFFRSNSDENKSDMEENK